MSMAMTDQQVAEQIAKLSGRSADPGLAREAIAVGGQVKQRQLTKVRLFYDAGLKALRDQDLRNVLAALAKDLSIRAEHVDGASRCARTVPTSKRRLVGR